ncbi:MAG: hypothetical protein H7A46_17620 [Verrucomicrobiales bacterium]|nr:hypothetical protein [Verrucomicrobiales bacterium]
MRLRSRIRVIGENPCLRRIVTSQADGIRLGGGTRIAPVRPPGQQASDDILGGVIIRARRKEPGDLGDIIAGGDQGSSSGSPS